MNRTLSALSVGVALSLTYSSAYSEDNEDEKKYIEEVIVKGERGDIRTLDRAMTVTGFSSSMIEELGIRNTSDLEVLVPGMQVGARSQGGGKNEDGHIIMRGVANDRSVNFFQDVSVAVYIDGVYSDQSYGLDQGAMFDVERVEIARGPQGTTGGKAAIAGSISFVTKKPTDEWDFKAAAEFTDQMTQEVNLAFGGPIADSNFSYRLGIGRTTGDGRIENIGSGPDAGEPDQLIYSPQLRFKNDRWDITGRYSKLTDEGTPDVSLIIGARNTQDEFVLDANGDPVFTIDPATLGTTNEPIRDANGDVIFQINPFFGLGQNPAVAKCSGFNLDGTRTPGSDVVCDGRDLQLKTEINAPISRDNSQEAYTLEAHYLVSDSYELIYKYGNRDTRQDTSNDSDLTNRQGGGVCSPIHPRVLSGELTAGQTHARCALDGAGNGAYNDSIANYLFTSAQESHEITLVSNNVGAFNFTAGYTHIKGDEPYVFRGLFNGVETGSKDLNNPDFYNDTTAICESELAARNGGEDRLWRNILDTNSPANQNAGFVQGCRGADYSANWSNVSNGRVHANGNNVETAFYGDVSYESQAVYGNAEYVLNDEWKVFGGLRFNDDHKEHDQNDFSGSSQYTNDDGVLVNAVFGIFRSKKFDYACCGYVGENLDANGVPIPDARTLADSKRNTWRETTWVVGGEYTPDDNTMWYGRISRGYRPGGFAGFGAQLGEAFDAELMINYEVGLKGLFFDNRVQLESTVYFQDFSAFHAQAGRLRTPAELRPGESIITGETTVIDGTTIAGVEVQAIWQINGRLTASGFYEYQTSSFGDYQARSCCLGDGTTAPVKTTDVVDGTGATISVASTGLTDFGGNSLRNQPDHKFSVHVNYDVAIPSNLGSLELVTLMSWRDTMFVDETNLDIFAVPAYTRWDIRANWRSANGRYTVNAWATNLLDEIAVQSYSPREGNGVSAPINGTITDERRIGLTLGYQL